MRGLADRYRHAYDVIDLDLVWRELHGYMPQVKAALESEIAMLQSQPQKLD